MAPPPSAKPGKITGVDQLKDSRLAKGMATTIEERQLLGIHGLLPPRVKTQAEQVSLCLRQVRSYRDPLDQYIYLMDLLERNERLFYKLMSEETEELMPVVYTPTVGEACQKFGYIYRRPQGLFISIKDKGHVKDVLRNWPRSDVKAICVTDGERILGLGDLGAQGMGIPVGKLALYTALADIPPYQTLPIVLDVGTNRQELRDSEDYIGLRQPRTEGQEYDEFLDEFMESVVALYGQNTLIQFEDFGKNNAFRLLEKYRDRYCTFNDDIQGTASVALAGILTALRASGKKLTDHTFLFQGAGQAAVGIAMLIAMAMEKREGISREEALGRIWLRDSKGLVVKGRPEGGISEPKEPFAHEHAPLKDLMEIIKDIKPTCLIGAAAIPNVFTEEVIKEMAELNEKPIIFALSNPTSKAECTAEAAYTHSQGRAIFASGSPFPTFHGFGKTFEPGQGNNAYIFPGLSLGIIGAGIRHVHESIFLFAAEGLSKLVTEEDLEVGRMYPPLSKIKQVSIKIASKVAEEAYKEGMASTYPEPEDKESFIRSRLYNYNYEEESSLPTCYPWV